jgi:hypothetical protein
MTRLLDRRRAPRCPALPAARLNLEILETRTLLSATLVLDGPQTLVPYANINVANTPTVDESEMTIAVNPTNPLNVAGFSHYIQPGFNYNQIAVFYSLDGGVSWTTTLVSGSGTVNNDGQGSSPSYIRFDPTIKFDNTGNLYIAYGAFTGSSTKLMVGVSTDGGASFPNSSFVVVDNRPGYGGVDKFYLATGPAGPDTTTQAVYVSYERNSGAGQPIMVSGSNDGGATFTTPFMVDTVGNGSFFAGPAVGPNGELCVVWQSTGDAKIKSRAKPDGLWGPGSWQPMRVVRNLNTALAQFSIPPQPHRGIYNTPVIDVDRSGGPFTGRAYVTFVDRVSGANTDVFLSYSDDGGDTWSSLGSTGNVENDPNSDFHSWVAVDQASGSVNVLYRTGDGSPSNNLTTTRLATSIDGGQTFSKVDLSSQQSNASVVSYIGDFLDYTGFDVYDGTLHGLWSDNRGANPGTYTTYLNAYTAMAATTSDTQNNTLVVNGDTGGIDDTILVRPSAVNSDFVEVIVNGQTQYAGLMLSINNIVVNGGDGNNVIVVGSFSGINVTVNGSTDGRNVMISETAGSTLIGGNGENVLIGGSTQWDSDTTALAAIMAEWTRTDLAYADRVDHLLNGGGLNGSYVLTASTVTGNGGGNTLLGGSGLNLYYGDLNLDTYDWDPSTETFVSI